MIVKINQTLLKKSLRRLGVEEQVEASQVLEEFQRLIEGQLGKKTRRLVKPLYLKNQTLHISVTSSVLATEIKIHQGQIIKNLNYKFKKTLVKNLRFLV
ncbi:MAG: DciA family protein [Patescibacteria group bacterium]